jgi:hypothetical protein
MNHDRGHMQPLVRKVGEAGLSSIAVRDSSAFFRRMGFKFYRRIRRFNGLPIAILSAVASGSTPGFDGIA